MADFPRHPGTVGAEALQYLYVSAFTLDLLVSDYWILPKKVNIRFPPYEWKLYYALKISAQKRQPPTTSWAKREKTTKKKNPKKHLCGNTQCFHQGFWGGIHQNVGTPAMFWCCSAVWRVRHTRTTLIHFIPHTAGRNSASNTYSHSLPPPKYPTWNHFLFLILLKSILPPLDNKIQHVNVSAGILTVKI